MCILTWVLTKYSQFDFNVIDSPTVATLWFIFAKVLVVCSDVIVTTFTPPPSHLNQQCGDNKINYGPMEKGYTKVLCSLASHTLRRDRGRVRSRCNYRVVAEECNYRPLRLGNKMLASAKHVVM